MRKLVLFMHTSLDGFVAGPNGEMDWIIVDEEIFDFAGQRTDASDTALYGRVTYEMMESYWPTAGDKPDASKHDKQHSMWYNNVRKVIISKTMKGKELRRTTIVSDNISSHINELKQKVGTEIVIFGSPGASHTLMAEGLIDDFWLFVNPILLGQGIPLFKNIRQREQLKLVTNRLFSSGVMCLQYQKIT